MYMLEGVSRWNMGRAKEAVDVEGASALRSFDVHLISHLNKLSQRVHGCAIVPEFTPPGKPTGKRALKATLEYYIPSSFFSLEPLYSEDMHFLGVKIVLYMREMVVYSICVSFPHLCVYTGYR